MCVRAICCDVQFNFVEYPPEEKKLPSGDEIMRMMQEREAKRQLARVEETRRGVQAHLAAAAAAKEVGFLPPCLAEGRGGPARMLVFVGHAVTEGAILFFFFRNCSASG